MNTTADRFAAMQHSTPQGAFDAALALGGLYMEMGDDDRDVFDFSDGSRAVVDRETLTIEVIRF